MSQCLVGLLGYRIAKLLRDAAFTLTAERERERAVMLVEKVTYFGEFAYLNSSCIRKIIILINRKQ